jgi:ketosteroid isomerase-like protein
VAGVYCAFAIVKSVSLLHGTLADERGQRLSEESDLNTKETIQGYFSSLKQKKGWESFLSNDMIFTSFTSPIRRIRGRAAYLEGTKRFYSMITAMEVKDLIVEGEKACALTHYELQPPGGPAFGSDVAEVFAVQDGKINSFDIYFDSAPFPK